MKIQRYSIYLCKNDIFYFYENHIIDMIINFEYKTIFERITNKHCFDERDFWLNIKDFQELEICKEFTEYLRKDVKKCERVVNCYIELYGIFKLLSEYGSESMECKIDISDKREFYVKMAFFIVLNLNCYDVKHNLKEYWINKMKESSKKFRFDYYNMRRTELLKIFKRRKMKKGYSRFRKDDLIYLLHEPDLQN